MTELADVGHILSLGAAVAIGLLIGTERGWKSREAREGERIAGLRTFGLIGFLGGAGGLLGVYLDPILLGFVFLGFSAAAIAAYLRRQQYTDDISITGLVAALLTFVLGAIATLGHASVAASAAVVAALLLRLKTVLHGWLKRLEPRELDAALLFLLISVVMLPVLPDEGYGPWQALNPYEIWWMVVLIAGISFIGYFAMKIAGTDQGAIITALAAGMVSSTALTVQFARLARQMPGKENVLAAGILVACGIMFPRVLLVAGIIYPALISQLLLPVMVMSGIVFAPVLLLWWRVSRQPNQEQPAALLQNPMELKSALLFGALLALVVVLGKGLKEWFGDTGVYLLAAVSGITDVDAVNLTLSRMAATEDIVPALAAVGILIAATSNSLVKALLALSIGGPAVGLRVFFPLLFAGLAGLALVWFGIA